MRKGSIVDILKIVSWVIIIAVYGYFFGYGDNLGQLKEVYLSIPHLIVAGVFFVLLFVLNFICYKENLKGDLINYKDIEFYNSLGADKKYKEFGAELKKLNSYISSCKFMSSFFPALKVVFILFAFAFGWGYIKSKFSVILFLIIAVISYILNIICSKIESKYKISNLINKLTSVKTSFDKYVLKTDDTLDFIIKSKVKNAKFEYIKRNKGCFLNDDIEDILKNIEREKIEEYKEQEKKKKEESIKEKEQLKEKYKDISDDDISMIMAYKGAARLGCTSALTKAKNTKELSKEDSYNLVIEVLNNGLNKISDTEKRLYSIVVEELKEEYKKEFC